MTKKEQLIEIINTQNLDELIMFTEQLDDGRTNQRLMKATREHIAKLIQDNFDDELHGHYGDEVYTTIMHPVFITETTYEEV